MRHRVRHSTSSAQPVQQDKRTRERRLPNDHRESRLADHFPTDTRSMMSLRNRSGHHSTKETNTIATRGLASPHRPPPPRPECRSSAGQAQTKSPQPPAPRPATPQSQHRRGASQPSTPGTSARRTSLAPTPHKSQTHNAARPKPRSAPSCGNLSASLLDAEARLVIADSSPGTSARSPFEGHGSKFPT